MQTENRISRTRAAVVVMAAATAAPQGEPRADTVAGELDGQTPDALRLADPDMQNPMFSYPKPGQPWRPGQHSRPAGPIDGEDFNHAATGRDFRIPTWRAETYKMAVFPCSTWTRGHGVA